MDVKQVVDPESNPVLFFLHMKILHLISQLPDLTGSGKYLQALLRLCTKAGHENFLVAGIQDDFSLESTLIDKQEPFMSGSMAKELNILFPA